MSMDLDKASAFNSIAWLMANNIANENGSPIEFKNHTFMIEPYLDNSERQAVRKCAQIGWSTLAILRSFHLAKYAGANIIHTFPSRNIAKDFVVPKVDPLIAGNPAIKQMVGVDSVHLKQVAGRFIYYRGTYEQTEAISISAHILINDEYDRSNQKVIKTYRSRLDDAKRERPELGWEWRFSNPTIPGAGVDEIWQKSDMKHWFVKCSWCNYDWYLKFPENINFRKQIRICAKCKRELSRDDLTSGRWVNKKTSDISGYWISQMFVPWISAEKIIEDSEGDQDIFHNFTLGLPFVSQDTAISRESIIKCLSPGYNPKTNVAIGVDNGRVKHYVIGNRYGIFEVGTTEDWQTIENMRNQYGAVMVIDSLPYPTHPAKLAEKYPGKVFVHYYRQDRKDVGAVNWDFKRYIIKSDRTKIIDAVVADINSRDIMFNLSLTELEDYIYQCQQIYRTIVETPDGIKRPRWRTIENKPDHYLHATVLWRLALEQTIGQGGIISPMGPSLSHRHPMVNPDGTVPALDLQQVIKRAEQKKQYASEDSYL